jgi:CheY-like chemotaxis protein
MKDVKFPGKHILLVEDIDINREIVAAMLEDTEVSIDYAENGLEAVAMFSQAVDKYDLIFMDIKMPQMDGYAATAKIRAMDAVQARNIPIVAMTANVFKEDAEHCINAGMNGHISKPIDRVEVLWAMQRFIV